MEVLVSMLTSIEELLGIGGPELVSVDRVNQALTAMQSVTKSSEERRTDRGERTAEEDFDEEEAEALEVDICSSCLLVAYWHASPFYQSTVTASETVNEGKAGVNA